MPDNVIPRGIRRVVDWLVLATGWWLVILSVLTCVEMVLRKVFSFSLQGIDEVGGYTLAVAAACGFSYTLLTRGHTRIDFLVNRLPALPRAALNTLAMLTLAGMATFAVLRGWTVLAESIEFQSHSTTPLQTPMWLPQSLWLAGWALFSLCALWMAGHAAALFVAGAHDAVNRLYGPQTLDEEIEAEAGEVLAQARAEVEVEARAEADARGGAGGATDEQALLRGARP